MTPLFIDGFALWPPDSGAGVPPAATLLAANERRRAPDSVLVALEVAQAAVQQAGADARTLASVFTSTHGDLPIVDALCTSLAGDPLLLSPTRFHHSVHNAASGYWAIASGSHAPSTALSCHEHSFAAGWLEAAARCEADQRPVLLVGFDTEACGALACVNRSRGLLGIALVLAPQRGPRSMFSVAQTWLHEPMASVAAPTSRWRSLADNAMAAALPLFEALVEGRATTLKLALGAELGLQLDLLDLGPPAAAGAVA
jgi:hypothetical protein